jgi:predicted aconitase
MFCKPSFLCIITVGRLPDIENFCKSILGVKSATTNAVIYCKLGRLPLECVRKLRILKYWLKLLATKNCILKSCYEHMCDEMNLKQNCKNWVVHIISILKNIGLFID